MGGDAQTSSVLSSDLDLSGFDPQVLELLEALHTSRPEHEEGLVDWQKTIQDSYAVLIAPRGEEADAARQERIHEALNQIISQSDPKIRNLIAETFRLAEGQDNPAVVFAESLLNEAQRNDSLWLQTLIAGANGDRLTNNFNGSTGVNESLDVEVVGPGQDLVDFLHETMKAAHEGESHHISPDVVQTGLSPQQMAEHFRDEIPKALLEGRLSLPGIVVPDFSKFSEDEGEAALDAFRGDDKLKQVINRLIQDVLNDAQPRQVQMSWGVSHKFWNYSDQINEAVNGLFEEYEDAPPLLDPTGTEVAQLDSDPYKNLWLTFRREGPFNVGEPRNADGSLIVDNPVADGELPNGHGANLAEDFYAYLERQVEEGDVSLPDGMSKDRYLDIAWQAIADARIAALEGSSSSFIDQQVFAQKMEKLSIVAINVDPDDPDNARIQAHQSSVFDYSHPIAGLTYDAASVEEGEAIKIINPEGEIMFEMLPYDVSLFEVNISENSGLEFDLSGGIETLEDFEKIFGEGFSMQYAYSKDTDLESDNAEIVGVWIETLNGNEFFIGPTEIDPASYSPSMHEEVVAVMIDEDSSPKSHHSPGPIMGQSFELK